MQTERTSICGRKKVKVETTKESNETSSSQSDNVIRITEVDTTIISPNYPDDYGPDIDCSIVVEFPENQSVQLQFQYFDLEKRNCKYDYLEIVDNWNDSISTTNKSDDSQTIRKCGTDIPSPFTSKGNKVKLRFKTDSSDFEKGFKLLATTGMKNLNLVCMHAMFDISLL